MKMKLIIPVILVVILNCAFSGCSYNSTGMTSTPDSSDITCKNETPEFVYVYRVFNNENCDEEWFRNSEDIKIFTTAIETGTPIDVPLEVKTDDPSVIKISPYVVELNYSKLHDAYFFYVNQDSGWAYGHSLGKAFELSEKSIEDLNQLDFFSLQHAQDAAIVMAVKEHPEFLDKVGIKEVEEKIGGPKGNKTSVKYETKVEKKADNIYTVTLTKTWGIKVQGSTPVSYWKYDVSPEKMTLVDENTTGEELVSIIK